MVRPAQTARSERTREALRQAAVVRFLAQGVEETSAEQIAADAGVSLRTFYRHFASKHDLLFADYDAGLHWFRAALAERSPDESIIESVQSAILARPYDDWAVAKIPTLRAQELDPTRIVRHIRQVETDFAEAIEEHLTGDEPLEPGSDDRMRITVVSRCIAAAVFGAMEFWMLGEDRSLPELTRLTREAMQTLSKGIGDIL
jgi:AcrR family transcriptional regulator